MQNTTVYLKCLLQFHFFPPLPPPNRVRAALDALPLSRTFQLGASSVALFVAVSARPPPAPAAAAAA